MEEKKRLERIESVRELDPDAAESYQGNMSRRATLNVPMPEKGFPAMGTTLKHRSGSINSMATKTMKHPAAMQTNL